MEIIYIVKRILLILRNLKYKAYDRDMIIQELTKKQKEIFVALKILVHKKRKFRKKPNDKVKLPLTIRL